jgi:hypothetical protein
MLVETVRPLALQARHGKRVRLDLRRGLDGGGSLCAAPGLQAREPLAIAGHLAGGARGCATLGAG